MDRPESRRGPNVLILIAGLASSAVCLLIVHLVNRSGFELMGFYLWHVVPVGALLVGLGSGSGYAIASRAANVRISKAFLGLVFVLALATYVAAQYLTYLHVLKEQDISRGDVSFVQYVRIVCENMRYSGLHAEERDIELGKLGYVAQALGILGFSIGATFPVWVLRQFAYCPTCQLYMTEAGTYYAVSTAQEADLTKKSKKQKETIIVEAVKEVSQPHEDLMARIAEAPLDDTVSALRELTNAGPGKAVAYLKYELSKCPRCDNHHITVTLGNLKVDRQRNTQELAKLSKISSRDPHESGAQSRM